MSETQDIPYTSIRKKQKQKQFFLLCLPPFTFTTSDIRYVKVPPHEAVL